MSVGFRFGSRVLWLIAAALLVGCDGSARYVGTWRVDKEAAIEAMDSGLQETSEEFGPLGEALAKEMTRQLVAGMDMTLEVRRDGTWRMTGVVMGAEHVRSGRWTIAGGDLVMTGEGTPGIHARIRDERLVVDRAQNDAKLVFAKE